MPRSTQTYISMSKVPILYRKYTSEIKIHVIWVTRLVTTTKLDDNLHGWTTDCLDGFQKSFEVIFSFDLEPFLK